MSQKLLLKIGIGVAGLTLYFSFRHLPGIVQCLVVMAIGFSFIGYAIYGMQQGEIHIRSLGLVKRAEHPDWFRKGIAMYFIVGSVCLFIGFLVIQILNNKAAA
jgi:hypothetical protein